MRPPAPGERLRVRLWLAAAALLCVFPLAPRLTRPLDAQLRLPATPVDLTDLERAHQWIFLESCAPYLPLHTSFTVMADDPDVEMALFMMAFGCFPSTYPMPNTYYATPMPGAGSDRARFLLRYRMAEPADPGLRLIARVDGGAVYERRPRP